MEIREENVAVKFNDDVRDNFHILDNLDLIKH